MRVLVAGGSGFIGSHLCVRLRQLGHTVTVADWQRPRYWSESELCDRFLLLDLRSLDACLQACTDQDWVFNLAADMGGMGFIESNHSRILYNNMMISLSLLEAARSNKVSRFFYASSACVYPVSLQRDPAAVSLKEDDAWPAQPQDAYGLEKLVAERAAEYYSADWGIEVRIARFHNIYGPRGEWQGGREKAPAAMCRKAVAATSSVEIWGDGHQSRSFCYIDDAVDGILRLMQSDHAVPVNIGSDEVVSMNQLMAMALGFAGKPDLEIRHVSGPQGVRGRNSDNTLVKHLLAGWAPSTPLRAGLLKTFTWIKEQMNDATAAAASSVPIDMAASVVVQPEPPSRIGDVHDRSGSPS